jgi:hypothetical protein
MCDPSHNNRYHSIYVHTEYLVNSDMAIPLALARGLVHSTVEEMIRRTGLPEVSREPVDTARAYPRISSGKGIGGHG